MRDSLAYHVERNGEEAEDREPSSLALVYQLPQVLRAMREHLGFPGVQQQAAVALANIAHQRQRQYAQQARLRMTAPSSLSLSLSLPLVPGLTLILSVQAVEAGACEALVAALVAHPANTKVLRTILKPRP